MSEMFAISVLGWGYSIGKDCVDVESDYLAGFLNGDFQHYLLNTQIMRQKFTILGVFFDIA